MSSQPQTTPGVEYLTDKQPDRLNDPMGNMATATLPSTTKSSLFDIEVGWIPLLEARIDAETNPDLSGDRPVCLACGGRGESADGAVKSCTHCDGSGRSKSQRELAIEAADVALAEHSEKEIERADSYIGLIRYLERAAAARREDAKRQHMMASVIEGMISQVKATAVNAMGAIGRKRIDGTRGYLLAKGNGGVAPLVIDNPALVPDELCKLEGWVNAGVWSRMVAITRRHMMVADWEPTANWTARVPDNTAIRAQLAQPCVGCSGSGRVISGNVSRMSPEALESGACTEEMECTVCGGSGKQGVPGARVGERGSHLEVK